jgi:protein SCO1/2
LLIAVLTSGAGCSRPSSSPVVDTARPREQRYVLHGEIVTVNRERNTLTVTHEAIPGLMPAMTMEFGVTGGDLAIARPGARIKADLVRDGRGFHLEKVWPDDRADAGGIATAAMALRQDTAARGAKAYREIGETMPDFALYDEDGRIVQAARFRGRQIMLNFVYSRCPVATMCPAATLRMMAVQKAAREAGVTNLQLISVTLDPENDTPGVLKEYATARGIDTRNFALLTGPEAAVRDLLVQFGVIAEFKDGLLKHSLATLLIDERGRLIHRADGSEWTVDEFVDRMRKG